MAREANGDQESRKTPETKSQKGKKITLRILRPCTWWKVSVKVASTGKLKRKKKKRETES